MKKFTLDRAKEIVRERYVCSQRDGVRKVSAIYIRIDLSAARFIHSNNCRRDVIDPAARFCHIGFWISPTESGKVATFFKHRGWPSFADNYCVAGFPDQIVVYSLDQLRTDSRTVVPRQRGTTGFAGLRNTVRASACSARLYKFLHNSVTRPVVGRTRGSARIGDESQ